MTRPTVMITGAAAGIGRATALRLAREGYRVAAYDVDVTGLEKLRADLGSDETVTGTLDVRDAGEWRTRLEELGDHTGGTLDVLVNNAGILRSGRFAEIALEDQQRIVDVNLTGILNGCHTAHPYLRATPGAQVVNLASASAIYGQPELATYSATKFAVRGLTEALELEWRDDDIRVSAIWPLFVATAMVEGMDIASSRRLGVHLTPEDVAETIAAVVVRRGGRRVHHAVGRQARSMLAAAGVSPSWVLRAVNRRVARD